MIDQILNDIGDWKLGNSFIYHESNRSYQYFNLLKESRYYKDYLGDLKKFIKTRYKNILIGDHFDCKNNETFKYSIWIGYEI